MKATSRNIYIDDSAPTTYRKNHACKDPNCGGRIYIRAEDFTGNDTTGAPVWVCANCNEVTKRRTRVVRNSKRAQLAAQNAATLDSLLAIADARDSE